MSNYEYLYPLQTPEGVISFLENYRVVEESRYLSGDFDLCDLIIDFDDALEKVLNEEERKMVMMYYSDGYTQSEVASVFGISQPYLYKKLKHYVQKLAEFHKERLVEKDD